MKTSKRGHSLHLAMSLLILSALAACGGTRSQQDRVAQTPVIGVESCPEIFACLDIQACSATNSTCKASCIERGTEAARAQYHAYVACGEGCDAVCAQVADLPGLEACINCQAKNCAAEITACGRVFSCKEVYACFETCVPNDGVCFAKCITRSEPLGYLRFITLETCIAEAIREQCASTCADDPLDQACLDCYTPLCQAHAETCGLENGEASA